MLAYSRRNHERLIRREAEEFLGQPHFLRPQRLAMSAWRILLVRRAIADMTVHDNQSGAVAGGEEPAIRSFQHLDIVGIGDAYDFPSVGQKSCSYVLGNCDIVMPFDGYAVTVIDPAKVGEAQMTRQ